MAKIEFEPGADQFPVLEEGSYIGTIETVEPHVSQSGNPSVHWYFTVEHDGRVYHLHEYTSTRAYSRSPGARWLRALTGSATEADTEELVGRKVELRVIQRQELDNRTGEQITRNRVTDVAPA